MPRLLTTPEKIRALVGRTIVAADPRTERQVTEGGTRLGDVHHWKLTLDNRTIVTCVVEETDLGAVYGVDLIVVPQTR